MTARTGPNRRFPDFLIVGAARSGTTSLYEYLGQHPGIYMSPVKEPCFFAFSGRPTRFTHPETEVVWDLNLYLDLFAAATPGQVAGEASTIYLYRYRNTIDNLRRIVPDWQRLKIIAILRDPVERALSQYSAHRMWNVEPLPFEDALEQIQERVDAGWNPMVDYAGAGYYFRQIQAFRESFSHLKICLYEDLVARPIELLQDILKFLEIEVSSTFRPVPAQNPSGDPRFAALNRILQTPHFLRRNFPWMHRTIPRSVRARLHQILSRMNRGPRKHGQISTETIRRLGVLYRDDIRQLEELIGRDLSHWAKPEIEP